MFERKVFRKIRIDVLYHNIDIVHRINIQWLRWLGHVMRMDDDAPAKKVFDARVGGKRCRCRSRLRGSNQVEEE